MPRQKTTLFNNKLGFLFLCGGAFVISMFLSSWLFSTSIPLPVKVEKQTRTIEGYDFNLVYEEEERNSSGPRIGNTIDLANLKTENGTALSTVIEKEKVILAVVDNECGMCKIAADAMRYVRNQVENQGIKYYIISFTASPSILSKFVEATHVDAPFFAWSKSKEHLPEYINSMIVPYHLLIDKTGKIIRRWPGSNKDKYIRDRMANQIVFDVIEELSLKHKP